MVVALLAGGCESATSHSRPPSGATSGSTAPSTSPSSTADTVLGRPYQNPVYDQDFPDPAVLRVGNRYYAYGTQGNGSNIQVLTSPDLIHWTAGPDALPDLGSWASGGNTWAPEVLAVGGKYVLFYVEHDQSSGKQCIGRAHSDSPGGPFVDDRAAPLVADGALYLYWKNDGNCCGKPVQLWGQRLSPDAGSLRGSPVALLTNTRSWQGNLIEAPEMVSHGGRYFLFYSANDYGSDKYAVGYASCQGPTGPCRDSSEHPLLGSDAVAAGPGHCFVLDLAIGSAVPGRQLWLEPLQWVGGLPRMSPPS
jgi:beta-xylosidase